MKVKPWCTITNIFIVISSLNVFHQTYFCVDAGCSEPNVIEFDILGKRSSSNRQRRAATSYVRRLWPRGIIPYVISDNFSNATSSLIREAMNHWQSYTCLDFVKRTVQRDYIYIYSGKGCCSYVGKRGGRQKLSLGIGCDAFGIIVHELGHAIGFWHEQSRPDRDNYVRILYENIYKQDRHNFKKTRARDVDSRQQRYDFHSIMHYGHGFFAIRDGLDTILPKLRGIKKHELGKQYFSNHRQALSDQDIIQTNLMYRCNIFNENGGTIFARSGRFHSPNYPSPYPVAQDRVWIVTTERTLKSSLTLIFDDFSVGDNDGSGICKDDYVDIRNGKGFLARHLVQLCGNVKPAPITVLSESIYVRLHSQLPIHKSVALKKGFSVRFKTDECSSRMFKLKYSFSTPNFPRSYQPHTDCVWQIIVPRGYRIKVTFDEFNLRDVDNKEGCLDYVDLRNGNSPFSTFLGRFCGRNSPGVVTSASTSFRLIFHSTESRANESRIGFNATYEAVDIDECAEMLSDCDQACFNTIGGYICGCQAGFSFLPGVYGTCVDEDECEVNKGGCSHHCVNTIGGFYCTCPVGHYLVSGGKVCIDINECHLNPCAHGCKNFIGGFQCLCNKGYQLNEDKRTCSDINECEHSPCEQDCINTPGGYRCACKSGFIFDEKKNGCRVLPSCGKTRSASSGRIRSPKIPRYFAHPVECTWNIKISRASIINVAISVSWKRDRKCSSYLLLRYKTSDRQITLKICGKEETRGNILIRSNYVSVKYHVESGTRNRMMLKYTSRSKNSQCDQIFTETSGIINTPGFPFKYPANARCVWKIKNIKSRPLRLKFHFFDVESHSSCNFDYLEIRSAFKNIKHTRRIGKYCGKDKPPILIINPGQETTLFFSSDSTVQRRGFQADFKLA